MITDISGMDVMSCQHPVSRMNAEMLLCPNSIRPVAVRVDVWRLDLKTRYESLRRPSVHTSWTQDWTFKLQAADLSVHWRAKHHGGLCIEHVEKNAVSQSLGNDA